MARLVIISDTHGLLRPEAVAFLKGCTQIVHGGDIGGQEILDQLSAIAPVVAVRGNNDHGAWAEALPETTQFAFGGVRIYVLHDLSQLRIEPSAAGVQMVVCGHSHQPVIERRRGVLYVNPGSAGPRRFRLPVAVAEAEIVGGELRARIVELAVARAS